MHRSVDLLTIDSSSGALLDDFAGALRTSGRHHPCPSHLRLHDNGHPSKIEVTVSTAGDRARITAAGPESMPDHDLYEPGASLVWELSTRHGIAPDSRGIWAEVTQELP